MVLIKKYRPFKWSEIVGQKSIVKEMEKRSATLDFAEAQLYYGGTGLGKSVIAQMVACLLLDPNPIQNEDGSLDPNPETLICQNVRKDIYNSNIIFKDASAMSKDDVVNLEYTLNSQPFFGKNQVIIIDEAQELSKAGKGATLKMLEKNRKNTYIILCTMDIYTFDKSVRDRCTSYKFKAVSAEEIAKKLFWILEQEKLGEKVPVEFIEEGIFTIAEGANGSVRDAIQTLDRCLSGEIFQEEDIISELGIFGIETSKKLVRGLLNKDKGTLKKIYETDLKSFFYYSEKILTETLTYKICGYTDSGWKKKFAKEILMHPNFDSLINTYRKIRENMNYFSGLIYMYHITEYYNKEKSINRVPIRTPV